MFTDILVAIDGSEHSKRALAEAADLAKLGNASLTAIAVAPDASAWVRGGGYGGFVAPVSLEELNGEMRDEYAKMLDEVTASVGEVPIEKVITHGSPAPAILEQIEKSGHDLVVMGSRGRGDVKSLFLGSVSHHVLQASPVPVLIVHAAEEGTSGH